MSARYVREETFPVIAPVLTGQAVEVCDLVGLSGGNIVRASDTSWASAVATPSAPTVANSAVAVGSPLTNAATGVKISYQFPWGEGALSAAGSATPTAGASLVVSGAPLVPATPALYTNVYVETAAGSGVYKLWGTTVGESLLVNSYGAGQVPAATTSGALDVTQYNFVQTFLGPSAQRKTANVARVPANSRDNVIRVDASGIFEFDCASATFALGDLVGPAKQSGNFLENQKVVAVAGELLAIGRVAEAATTVTKVLVRILTKALPGGRQRV